MTYRVGGFVGQWGSAVAAAAFFALCAGHSVYAQIETSEPLSQAATTESSGPAAIPIGTSVTLCVKQPVSSRTAKRGDLFEIELVNDIYIQALPAIPAGTKGMAQVVHASPKRFGGRAGELIVAARYLEANGRRLTLRKTKFSSAGSDNAGAAIVATIAAPVIGVFVTGTSVDLPAGGIIVAETAEIFVPAE
ncbi:MAG: hypothetical protein MK060_20005 [Blastomonas sp.]|uniref:hypothetical protein n=1 Tax=Blastomonas sp. TaxID=1909299 RepID=UPI0010F68778|nr:hypothetical protein [Blastomonas sp.]